MRDRERPGPSENQARRTVACLSKIPKLFGRISGDIIFCVYLKKESVSRHGTLQLFSFLLELQYMNL